MTGTSASYLKSTMAGADASYVYSTMTSTPAYTLYDLFSANLLKCSSVAYATDAPAGPASAAATRWRRRLMLLAANAFLVIMGCI